MTLPLDDFLRLDYLEDVVLRDGGSLVLRSISSADKALLIDLLRRMSPESIRYRFFGARSTFNDRELAWLTEVDQARHAALAACVLVDGSERVVGVGRYVGVPDAPRAELAFAVADEHQGRGIGTLLLERLARIARKNDIEEFEAEVLADNLRMLDVFAASGFTVVRTLDAGVFHVVFPTRESERFARASLDRERVAAAESVRVFFEPKSVAVVGASSREGTIGRALVTNLQSAKFRGPIYAVNPHAEEVCGLRAYPTVSATGARVDLAIVAVPAPAVEKVVVDCAAAGVRGVVIISAGFGETSSGTPAVEQGLRHLVRGSGMRLVGPNCMGVLNTDPAVSLNGTFAPTWPPRGNVSMLSQSGALGLAMLDHAERLNIGIASFVSVGNKADVSSNDLLSFWEDDPKTGVIVLYLESFGNPRKFARLAPEVSRKKPIVAVKAGRSAAGSRAASSHSAALASLDVGVDALFAQAGVIRTNTMEEMFDVVALLSSQAVPQGPRVGVLTNAGGPAILFADACEAQGLELPTLAGATVAQLRTFLPPQASLSNPVDMIASATPEQYARAIEVVGNDPNLDALVIIYIPPLVTGPHEVADAIARGAATVPQNKPIATVFMSSKGTPAVLSQGPRGKLPSYSFPENAAIALAAAVRYGRWLERERGSVLSFQPHEERAIRRAVRQAREHLGEGGWVNAEHLAALLGLAGIRFAATEQVSTDAHELAASCERLGYPLVVKAIAPGLLHRSDVGGVILGLHSLEAVQEAVATLSTRLTAVGSRLEGVLLQQYVERGLEALVGVTTDPSLGPLLVAGLGGVNVELLRDVSFRLTPVSDLDARDMLDALRARRLLDGFRGAPAADREALLSVILRVSAFVELVPELAELDLNPIKVLPPGEGAIVVDARMRIV